MYFIVSLSSGVGMLGLPITMRVVHTCPPSCITLSVKSGWLTIHMRLAEVARIPAPALHVGDDGLDLARASPAPGLARSSASIALSFLYCTCGGLNSSSTLRGVGGAGDLVEDIRRIGRCLRKLHVAADAAIGETAGLHVAGIGEHRFGELELGLGQRIGGSETGQSSASGSRRDQARRCRPSSGARSRIWRAHSRRPCRARAAPGCGSDRTPRPPRAPSCSEKILSPFAASRSRTFSATARSAGSSNASGSGVAARSGITAGAGGASLLVVAAGEPAAGCGAVAVARWSTSCADAPGSARIKASAVLARMYS